MFEFDLPLWLRIAMPWLYLILVVSFYAIVASRRRWGRKIKNYEYFVMFFMAILAIVTTLINLEAYLPNLGLTVAVLVVWCCVVLDNFLTRKGLKLGAQELNPVMRWLMKKMGPNKAVAVPLIVTFVILCYPDAVLRYGLILLYLLVLCSNLYQLHTLKMRKARALTVYDGGKQEGLAQPAEVVIEQPDDNREHDK